jgi:hypothetical protein
VSEQRPEWQVQVASAGEGGSAKLRVHGTVGECAETVKRLHGIFAVVSVSDPYPDRGASRLVRVYVEVRL